MKVNSLLIDGENLLKQGFHGVKDVQTSNGSTGTVFHFINTIKRFYSDYGITKVVVFWEGENSKEYRCGYYPYYKGNRKNQYTEDQLYDLGRQRNRIKQYLEELYIRQVEVPGCEADDGIAYYCVNSPKESKIIFSNDQDMLQLIGEDVKVYVSKKKVVINQKNFQNYYDYHYGNVGLIKMIAGDPSDNISGLKNIGEEKTLKLFPELKRYRKDYNWIMERTDQLLLEQPDNKLLKTIKEGDTKWGAYGSDYFAIMNKVINLFTPNVTDELKAAIQEVISEPLDPTGRGGVNKIVEMMKEDGIIRLIPNYDEGYFVFWSTFITIIKKEENYFKSKK